MVDSATSERRPALKIAAIAGALITGFAVVGTFQTLVWNPQAAVPGMTLEEIRAAMAKANEILAEPLVLVWAVTGALLAGLVLIAAQRGAGLLVSTVVRMDLLLLVLAAPSHWFASFPARQIHRSHCSGMAYPAPTVGIGILAPLLAWGI